MNIDGMTDEQKRIAIAEACGWKNVRRTTIVRARLMKEALWGVAPIGGGHDQIVPNFLNSIDAMREAVEIKKSDRSWYWAYYNLLETAVCRANDSTVDGRFVSEATAAERANAFLLPL